MKENGISRTQNLRLYEKYYPSVHVYMDWAYQTKRFGLRIIEWIAGPDYIHTEGECTACHQTLRYENTAIGHHYTRNAGEKDLLTR